MGPDIKDIGNLKTLLSYASQNLNWDIDPDDINDIDDLTYEFDANDIHLKPEEFAKITSLKQLRPFHEKQPWGIFVLEFESRRFEITSLRKVLSGLVPRRRNRDHAVWDKNDLLFFCFWGEKSSRTFGVFHFEDKDRGLPQIKAFYCSPRYEDPSHLQAFEDKLEKLSWPALPANPGSADFDAWRGQWAGPFTAVYRQTIRDSATLTTELAGIARNIQRRIIDIFAVETENGAIHELYEKFRKALIHDMTKKQFADMYAQTMVYGLFSARCMLKTGEGGDSRFEPREAIDAIPSTNPFLQKLLKESFSRKDKLSLKDKLLFDELDLGDITSLLQHTDTDRILEDFNRQTGGGREDPVIYFYEGFLNAYEKEQKKRRGVYYTPQPVVSFMVRAVDDILKTEFGIKDGLASTATKTIKIPGKKNGKPADDELWEVPAIQILDPAVGTGTFLRQTILQIWDNFKSARPGATKNSLKNQWNAYVKDKLLPRLNGFELMMAPYAVAHMKLAMCLDETGYAFDEDLEHPDRVKVFLTNSLEEADKEGGQVMMFEHDALTEESLEARKVKKNRGINVVIGNPPYSGESANKGDWILSLLDDYKKEPGGIEKLKEKNPKWINDDYVKFIRYAQVYVERAGSGIVAFINNHSFLDNPTFRGMRWNLLRSFDKIYIIDLHGNAKKKETTPDGSKDENVFDIQQGVSINIFIKRNEKANEQLAEVLHYDLYGLREEKYHFLNDNTLVALKWTELPSETPQYFLAEKNFANQDEYKKGFAIQELFSVNNVGIVTARDEFTIHYTKKGIKNTIEEFLALDDEDARNKFNLGKDVRDWKVSYAREDLEKTYPDKGYITEIAYRPFDTRWTFYTGQSKGFHCYPRENVMRHFLSGNNSGLALCRQFKVGNEFYHVFVSNKIIESSLVSNKTSEITSIFPLYLYPEEGHRTIEGKKRKPNLNITIVNDIANKLNLAFEIEKSGDKDKFAPVDLLDYIYAVLHSPAYRETYREFLKIDFPRIPYPADRDSFWKLVSLGGELRRLHLLESPVFDAITLEPGAAGKVPVEKIRYVDGKVFVNDVFFFANVPQAAWEFYIGGYQPAQKWLKDRKGRLLSGWDISHYRKIILALTETARVMEKIDRVGVV